VTFLLLAVAAGLGAAVTHWVDRRITAAADAWHYDRTRADVTDVRAVVEDADHKHRSYMRAIRENARLLSVNAVLCDQLARFRERARVIGPAPNPNPFPRIRLFRWLP
jgi:hypothetical protein